jgi:UDP-N-acetylglucosamine acyltransferase
MSLIHPTAIIDPKAQIDSSVYVGPYSVIGPYVKIDAGSHIGSHVVIEGHTTIGKDNRIFQFASIGGVPQDKKYKGEPTQLEIGDRNTIREYCTLNIGTVQDDGVTRVGDDNWLMAYVHIAHDCQVGSNTIFANGIQLAGHVHIGDWAVLGGMTLVHQYCKVGAHAMTGAQTRLSQDVPPFMLVAGTPPSVHGINVEGLRRRGFTPEQIADIRQSFRVLYKSGLSLEEARQALVLEEEKSVEAKNYIQILRLFLDKAERGIVR